MIRWRNKTTGAITCSPCTGCPKGMEPSIACGATVDEGTVLECRECIAGKSFSDSEGVGQCQMCTTCSQKVAVLKQCTTESNTVCGSCPPGFYEDDFIGGCFKCSLCCEGNNDLATDCESQGLPPKQRCKDLNSCGTADLVDHSSTPASSDRNISTATPDTEGK